MISVDQAKCTQCNQCVSVCPFTVIQNVNGYPQLIEGKTCIKCLHCVAICPQDALTYSKQAQSKNVADYASAPADTLPLSSNFAQQLAHMIQTRRSLRHYEDTPVAKEVIEDVLNTVKMAPSAKNQHPCKWIVVNGKEKVDQIMQLVLKWVSETGVSPEILSEYEAGNNCVTMNAPTLLIAFSSTAAVNPPTDCAIALTSAELLFQAKGIGTCWAGYLGRIANANEEIKNYLKLPREHQVYGILTMGYPKNEKYLKIPYRAEPKISWIE